VFLLTKFRSVSIILVKELNIWDEKIENITIVTAETNMDIKANFK